jgi:hypothetical protein
MKSSRAVGRDAIALLPDVRDQSPKTSDTSNPVSREGVTAQSVVTVPTGPSVNAPGVCVFQAEGENVSKLEKADILELTVRHLHRLRRPRDAAEDAHRFQVSCSPSRGTAAVAPPLGTRPDQSLRPSRVPLRYLVTAFNYTDHGFGWWSS